MFPKTEQIPFKVTSYKPATFVKLTSWQVMFKDFFSANVRLGEDMLKTSWRHLQHNIFLSSKTSLKCLQNVFKTSSRRVCKMSWRHGRDFLFVYCNPSFISVLFLHLISLSTKAQSKLFKQTLFWEYSKQRSFMARSLNLPDVLGPIHLWRPHERDREGSWNLWRDFGFYCFLKIDLLKVNLIFSLRS